jgi:hypothetical protein
MRPSDRCADKSAAKLGDGWPTGPAQSVSSTNFPRADSHVFIEFSLLLHRRWYFLSSCYALGGRAASEIRPRLIARSVGSAERPHDKTIHYFRPGGGLAEPTAQPLRHRPAATRAITGGVLTNAILSASKDQLKSMPQFKHN